MDISETLAPKSDQMDYEDLISGPKTLTITEVRKGPSAEQPVEVAFKEFERPWRPAKTVRRILVACWGPEASAYIGRRVTLFGDATVKWGGAEVGGIRLSHASHITEPVTVALTVTRGKRAPFTVQPLPDDTDALTAALNLIRNATSLPALKTAWENAGRHGVQSHPDVIAAKDAAKETLSKEQAS